MLMIARRVRPSAGARNRRKATVNYTTKPATSFSFYDPKVFNQFLTLLLTNTTTKITFSGNRYFLALVVKIWRGFGQTARGLGSKVGSILYIFNCHLIYLQKKGFFKIRHRQIIFLSRTQAFKIF